MCSILQFIFLNCIIMSAFEGSASEFLNNLPNCPSNVSGTTHRNSADNQTRIGIIGGGVAGLSALKTLYDNGFEEVLLFEAQDRLGGRIHTIRDGFVLLEEGAQWIHGGERNPIFRIAQSLGALGKGSAALEETVDLRIKRTDGSSPSHNDYKISEHLDRILEDGMANGVLAKYYGEGYGKYYIDRFRDEISLGVQNTTFASWLHFMEQYVMMDEGTFTWEDNAARDADNYVDFGEDFTWRNGYDTLIDNLTGSVLPSSILLGTPIRRVVWELEDDEGVLVITENNDCYYFDHVIVTVSVGYLKRHLSTLFHPAIPASLQSHFNGIDLGTSNKIFIGWSDFWWGAANIELRILWTKLDLPPEMDWMHGIVDIFLVDEKYPILMTFVTGNYSLKMEQLEDTVVKDHVLFLFKHLFQDAVVPSPTVFRRSKWNSNPWTLGSYSSYVTREGDKAGLHSREQFRKPLLNKWNQKAICWAGEHTHDSRYGTVDGAYESGIREANRILNFYNNLPQVK